MSDGDFLDLDWLKKEENWMEERAFEFTSKAL
jgi:hypothetical protein